MKAQKVDASLQHEIVQYVLNGVNGGTITKSVARREQFIFNLVQYSDYCAIKFVDAYLLTFDQIKIRSHTDEIHGCPPYHQRLTSAPRELLFVCLSGW